MTPTPSRSSAPIAIHTGSAPNLQAAIAPAMMTMTQPTRERLNQFTARSLRRLAQQWQCHAQKKRAGLTSRPSDPWTASLLLRGHQQVRDDERVDDERLDQGQTDD